MEEPDAEVWQQAAAILKTIVALRHRIIARHAEIASAVGRTLSCQSFTIPQMNMLMAVCDLGHATVKELAEALQVSPPSASTMVERLVELGMLTREQSQVDRREVDIRIAPDFEESVAGIRKQILQLVVELFEKIGPEYTRMWSEVFARIGEALEEEKGQAGHVACPGSEVSEE